MRCDYIERNERRESDELRRVSGKHPARDEVEILENTAWSCAHGIERWRSDCRLQHGREPDGTSVAWAAREALDWLRDAIATLRDRDGHLLCRSVDGA